MCIDLGQTIGSADIPSASVQGYDYRRVLYNSTRTVLTLRDAGEPILSCATLVAIRAQVLQRSEEQENCGNQGTGVQPVEGCENDVLRQFTGSPQVVFCVAAPVTKYGLTLPTFGVVAVQVFIGALKQVVCACEKVQFTGTGTGAPPLASIWLDDQSYSVPNWIATIASRITVSCPSIRIASLHEKGIGPQSRAKPRPKNSVQSHRFAVKWGLAHNKVQTPLLRSLRQ